MSVAVILSDVRSQRSPEIEYEVAQHSTNDDAQEQPDVKSHGNEHQHVAQCHVEKMQQRLYHMVQPVKLTTDLPKKESKNWWVVAQQQAVLLLHDQTLCISQTTPVKLEKWTTAFTGKKDKNATWPTRTQRNGWVHKCNAVYFVLLSSTFAWLLMNTATNAANNFC